MTQERPCLRLQGGSGCTWQDGALEDAGIPLKADWGQRSAHCVPAPHSALLHPTECPLRPWADSGHASQNICSLLWSRGACLPLPFPVKCLPKSGEDPGSSPFKGQGQGSPGIGMESRAESEGPAAPSRGQAGSCPQGSWLPGTLAPGLVLRGRDEPGVRLFSPRPAAWFGELRRLFRWQPSPGAVSSPFPRHPPPPSLPRARCAHGTPVVGTDVPGRREAGVPGWSP